jgi:hypothetical protein
VPGIGGVLGMSYGGIRGFIRGAHNLVQSNKHRRSSGGTTAAGGVASSSEALTATRATPLNDLEMDGVSRQGGGAISKAQLRGHMATIANRIGAPPLSATSAMTPQIGHVMSLAGGVGSTAYSALTSAHAVGRYLNRFGEGGTGVLGPSTVVPVPQQPNRQQMAPVVSIGS